METGGAVDLQGSVELQKISAPTKKGISVWKKCAAVAAILFGVGQFYYFRELAAALLIFTILFLMLAAVAGMIYLIGRAGQKGISIAEPAARRGLVLAEAFSRKTFHRQRSVPVP